MSAPAARVILKRGREGPVRGGNPWIFSQAIERLEPNQIEAGATVTVHDAAGELLGLGYCNQATTIAVRMLAWGEEPSLAELVARRLRSALALRQRFVGADTDSYRLVNGDGDGLSGVVVDRFDQVLVMQLLTAGADRMRETLVAELRELLQPRAIVERSVGAVRKQEGLPDRVATLYGEPVSETVGRENGIRIHVDFEHGQKTGYFLDQRENRALAGRIAADARVLDAFCYEGGFALAALAGGARRVVAVDTSARALGWARKNLELNDHPATAVEFVHGEAGKFMAETAECFDLIVLDPPPLARSRADAERAGRLYVELNMIAMRALAPGGRLMTFSCST
ncbi:MAG TPA: class I SAM-dependent rRNA methyltransferase, partial [Candidatus Acidoferrales bacterium]|nr:class I SAM-dependent rRNA methyltransferase [Candidatus Acidoferrales bacterium]